VISYRFQDAEPLLETVASLEPFNPRSYELLATIAGRRADAEKVRDWEHVARKLREKILSQPNNVP
jgi:cytochrome c-type biogenesis protein CcmH/NrfG